MDKQVQEEGNIFWTSVLFLGVIIALPFLIDFSAKVFLALFGNLGRVWYMQNLWLEGITSYLPFYILLLFYLKTTFNPLAVYGYTWKKEYFWWAVYLGLGSGVVMFFIDKAAPTPASQVMPFGFIALLGYMIGWVLLPAFAEETLFRGVIQRFYQQHTKKTVTKWNISIAVFAASGAEMLFHLVVPVYFGLTTGGALTSALHTVPQIIYVFIFGFIGGVLYQRTGSLTCPIIIHALGNFTELVLLWLWH